VKAPAKIGFTLVIAFMATSAFADEAIGVITRTTGQVAIERAGVPLPPAPGTEVQRGDRVITGRDGQVSVAMRGAAPVTVGPEADVALDRFVRDQRPVVRRMMDPIITGVASIMSGVVRR
jgi:hypothetical protein